MSGTYIPSKRATFLYFAYGSNLWTKRIHLQNSSAIRKGIAQLKVNIEIQLALFDVRVRERTLKIICFFFFVSGLSFGFLSTVRYGPMVMGGTGKYFKTNKIIFFDFTR